MLSPREAARSPELLQAHGLQSPPGWAGFPKYPFEQLIHYKLQGSPNKIQKIANTNCESVQSAVPFAIRSFIANWASRAGVIILSHFTSRAEVVRWYSEWAFTRLAGIQELGGRISVESICTQVTAVSGSVVLTRLKISVWYLFMPKY